MVTDSLCTRSAAPAAAAAAATTTTTATATATATAPAPALLLPLRLPLPLQLPLPLPLPLLPPWVHDTAESSGHVSASPAAAACRAACLCGQAAPAVRRGPAAAAIYYCLLSAGWRLAAGACCSLLGWLRPPVRLLCCYCHCHATAPTTTATGLLPLLLLQLVPPLLAIDGICDRDCSQMEYARLAWSCSVPARLKRVGQTIAVAAKSNTPAST